MRSIDFNGYPLTSPVYTTECSECGMGLLDGSEFHPYSACLLFKIRNDSNDVRPQLERLFREHHAAAKA